MKEPATTTVTFALLSPILFLLLFGAMDGGRVLYAWLVITNEAREAARYGAVNYGRTDVSIDALVRNRLEQRLDLNLPRANRNPAPAIVISQDPSRQVDVTIHYQVPLVIPVVGKVLPNPFPLEARSVMKGE